MVNRQAAKRIDEAFEKLGGERVQSLGVSSQKRPPMLLNFSALHLIRQQLGYQLKIYQSLQDRCNKWMEHVICQDIKRTAGASSNVLFAQRFQVWAMINIRRGDHPVVFCRNMMSESFEATLQMADSPSNPNNFI